MNPRSVIAQLVGAILIAVLLVLLPDEVYRQARDLLLVAAAGVLLWVAVALFVVPVRNALATTFALSMKRRDGWFGLPADAELRATFAPLVVPFLLLLVAAASTALR